MSKIAPVIVAASLLVALAAIVIFTARGCGQPPPIPPTATLIPSPFPVTIDAPTRTSTPVRVTATIPPLASKTPSATFYAPTATVTPTATRTPVLTATPDLIGRHRVGRGDTMYGVSLSWYAGRYFAWGADVWRPVCDANPQIVDCRLIYPGDVLGVPRLP